MSRLIALGALVVLVGCDVGDVTNVGGPSAPDADTGDPDPDDLPPDAAIAIECRDPVAGVGSGEHNPGQACIACHVGKGEGPQFTVAGTLYADLAGTTPLAGATIVVTDATGATLDLVSQQNGNFYTTAALAFPIQVSATRCPDTTPMIGAVAAPGDCNAGGCHAPGSGAGPIHLP